MILEEQSDESLSQSEALVMDTNIPDDQNANLVESDLQRKLGHFCEARMKS